MVIIYTKIFTVSLKELVDLSYVILSNSKKSLSISSISFNKVYPVIKTYNYINSSGVELAILIAMYSKIVSIQLPIKHLIIGKLSLFGNVYSDRRVEEVFMKALESDLELIVAPGELRYKVHIPEKQEYPNICWIDEVSELNSLFAFFQDLKVIHAIAFDDAPTYSVKFLSPHIKDINAFAKEHNLSFRMAMEQRLKIGDSNKYNDKLEQLIGLKSIKMRVLEMIKYKEFCLKRKEAGYETKDISMHMAFYGNPGTGKTTIAKIIGKILYNKDLVPSSKFIEVCREDLVGKYIGHTEERVANVLEKARGGILYIDEAHSLFVDSVNDYGRIAISTLVKGIEEQREDTVLILSGYKNEMKEMIYSNVGLKERIGLHIEFEDYNLDELIQIFNSLCEKESYLLREGCIDKLLSYFEEVVRNKTKIFGNGRFVRNLFEKVKVMQSIRVIDFKTLAKEDFVYIEIDDIVKAIQVMKENVKEENIERKIGFNALKNNKYLENDNFSV